MIRKIEDRLIDPLELLHLPPKLILEAIALGKKIMEENND